MIPALVICSVMVMVDMGGFGMESHADLQGVIVAESDYKYVVNFAGEAKKHKWLGEYDKVIVNKTECVKITK